MDPTARFHQIYEQLVGTLLQHHILMPKPNQTLRPITSQEFMETICKDAKHRECIMEENAQFLKCVPFPTHQGDVLMIHRNKVYMMLPQLRSGIFDALKQLYWVAVYGPELSGVARSVQLNEHRQQEALYQARQRQEERKRAMVQDGPEGQNATNSSGEAHLSSFLSKFVSQEVTDEFCKGIREIVEEDTAAGNLPSEGGEGRSPMDMINVMMKIVKNEKMQKLFAETNEKTNMTEEDNQTMLTEMAEDALSKMNPNDPATATMAPLLNSFLKGGGVGLPSFGGMNDPSSAPGILETLMKTLEEQDAKGKKGDLQHTVTVLTKNYTAPVAAPIDDDDLMNMSTAEFQQLQHEMELD